MRVISQEGTIDVPYEDFVFGITLDNYISAVTNTVVRLTEAVNGTMAKYSSREKALKVMELLRKAWLGESVEFENGFYHRNIIFQFPQDDEIEV